MPINNPRELKQIHLKIHDNCQMMKKALPFTLYIYIYIPVTHLDEIIRFNSHCQYHRLHGHDERPLNKQLHHLTTEGDALYRPP